MRRQFTDLDGVVYDVRVQGADTWILSSEAGERTVVAQVRSCPDGSLLITTDGISRPAHVSRVDEMVWISTAGETGRWQRYERVRGAKAESGDGVRSPMTGKIVVVNVQVGDPVAKGDVLVVVEAMKMEQPLTAPRDGVVGAVACQPGDLVDGGVELVALVPSDSGSES